jgi:predicted dehydrogenase
MRLAVIGCGSIGTRHLKNLSSLGYADLMAVDPDPRARRKVEQELGITVLENLEAVWDKLPEAILVTGPTQCHREIAWAAARRGCHLFVEKPLAHSLEGLHELMQAADQRGLITMVGCNMRFHPGPRAVKCLLDEGVIGVPLAARLQTGSYLPRWRPWQDYRKSYSASPHWGGAILDCIHEIDLALWFLGEAQVVGAAALSAKALDLETDGLAEILLRHESGALSNVHLNFIQRDYWRTCQVIGTAGTVYWNIQDRVVRACGEDGVTFQEWPEPDDYDLNRMYVEELEHFLSCVQRQRPTLNPLAGGAAALKVALAAREMARKITVGTPGGANPGLRAEP